MAHTGKTYKVLFRRDWNFNVNTNQFGWANRYIAKLFKGTTGFGTLATRFTFDCGPATERFVSEMHWDSQVIPDFGFMWQVRLRADVIQGEAMHRHRLQLWELNTGMIAEWQNVNDARDVNDFFQTLTGKTLFWDPAFFDNYPFLENSLVRPKIWNDGAPF